MMYRWIITSLLTVLFTTPTSVLAEEVVKVRFQQGKWNRTTWADIGSAQYPRSGRWLDETDHIRNAVPVDATPEEMLGPRAAETHAGMIFNQVLTGDLTIESTLSFDHRMAPAILIAPKVFKNDDSKAGLEYQSHIQIVVFDKGINVWSGKWADAKFTWTKIGYARFDLPPKTKHLLRVKRKEKTIEVSINGRHTFGFVSDQIPNSFYTGIIAGEGINRFYSFRVNR